MHLLKIGDFSKLAHVTVKTLRHYAEIGLLKPVWIDRFSGYRYYNLEQLPRLNRILALKDLGFSLDQVAELLDENLPVEQMRGMLRRKQAEVESRLRAEQTRLEMVAARLHMIELEGHPLGTDVLVKRVEPLTVAALHETVPSMQRIPSYIERMGARLTGLMRASSLEPDGPWLALHDLSEYRERSIPLELGVVVSPETLRRAMPGSREGLNLRMLPAVEQMACLVHTGPPDGLPQAYSGLYAWMDANRCQPYGLARELYLRDEGGESPAEADYERPASMTRGERMVVEVQIPVERVGERTVIVNGKAIKETKMQPKIVSRPEFTVVGYCYHGDNKNQEIAAMWGKFTQRMTEIQTNNERETFGVCTVPAGLPEGHFEYVAAMQVPDDAPVPEGMVKRTIPAYQYAVFEHVGEIDKLGETYRDIYQSWLPQAGLDPIEHGLDIEVYDEHFADFAPHSLFYIYVPVK